MSLPKQQVGGKLGETQVLAPCSGLPQSNHGHEAEQESMVVKCSLLSFWSFLEGVRGTQKNKGSLL